ncbi:hypothetical protein LOK49_LG01G00108 [Camellia lanceoleosa]|uniref:Uncharacterized protein n=1 Tax=Camellia lanceoleosa TaxID=1840588 RepID=A0ACC0J3D5_9ERIC|nr:hypothetical protein LOK49_LG01G00108 [Camellia lanceoleosa]
MDIGKTLKVHNPANGEVIANVSCMGVRETNDAIVSAYDAFKSWSKLTAAERSKCLRKWYDLIVAHKEELGQLITLEQGKPLKEAIAELSLQAGIPPGAVNVVMGNASETGDALITSPQVRKITFTGSIAVGKKLMAGAAGTVKKVSLELGGNAPCIIFDDADLDVAIKGTGHL